MEWIYLYVAIAAEVIATSALKASGSFTRLEPSIFAVVGYRYAFYLRTRASQKIPLGVAYAIWSVFGIVLVALIGAVRYRERLDLPAQVGIGMIVAGVLVINLMSKSLAD
ncbi:MAG: multidrug efflux SMR transporter [Hyphomicrobium sp.]|jgi:small multidrug resistance pump